jgi:hypothetical protein
MARTQQEQAWHCGAAVDGEGVGDDGSRAPLSSDGVGVSRPTSRRSVGRSAAGGRRGREGEASVLDLLNWLRRRRPLAPAAAPAALQIAGER